MDIQFFFGLLTLFILLFLFKWIKTRKTTPPGPWKLPFIGNIHNLIGSLPHHNLRNLSQKHGPLMHLQLGEISLMVVSSSRVAKEVMNTHDFAFLNRPEILASKIILYNSSDIAFSPYGDYWKQMRKICTLEFLSKKTVRSFSSIREDEVCQLIQSVKSSEGLLINISEMIDSTTNAITCRAAFGQRCKDQEALIELIEQSESSAGGFDISDLFPSLKVLHSLSGTRAKLEKIHQNIDRILDGIVRSRGESLQTSKIRGEGDEREEDLLDILLMLKENNGLKNRITTDNIKAVIMDLFSAGTGTTATVIDWAMSEMMKKPKVMETAQAQLRQALKGKKIITGTDIQELSYLKCVVKETLRLHPAAPLLLPRVCTQQCDIDGYNVPVNTRVIVNAWAIGRDPENWHNPESFQPERFKNSFIGFGEDDFKYIPFGAGRRMCPGISFGLAIVELFLAQLLYHFNWKLPIGIEPSDLDMSEKFGATTRRRDSLCLIATFHSQFGNSG